LLHAAEKQTVTHKSFRTASVGVDYNNMDH